MIQTNDADTQDELKPMLYNIGCVGKISSFEETPDGRYLISLDGLIRFNIIEEIEMKDGYRQVNVTYNNFIQDLDLTQPEIDRQRLLSALKLYFDQKGFTADWDAIKSCESEKLVTTLSMICPLGNQDKQALLEAEDTQLRAETLATLLEMENSFQALSGEGQDDVRH